MKNKLEREGRYQAPEWGGRKQWGGDERWHKDSGRGTLSLKCQLSNQLLCCSPG